MWGFGLKVIIYRMWGQARPSVRAKDTISSHRTLPAADAFSRLSHRTKKSGIATRLQQYAEQATLIRGREGRCGGQE